MKTGYLLAAILGGMISWGAYAEAATFDALLTADGDVQTFGGDSVETAGAAIAFTQSGGLIRNGILEFDLSGLADDVTVNSATLSITLTRFVSNTGSNPAAIDIFAYNGDGAVTLDDFDAAGTQVADTTTATGGVAGDVRAFDFSDVIPVTGALADDLLTLRIETDSFASINFAALENTSLAAASLSIDYTAAPTTTPVPLPAGMPLILAGAAAFGVLKRRQSKA